MLLVLCLYHVISKRSDPITNYSPNQRRNNMNNEFRKLKRTKKYITNSRKFQLLPKKFMSVDIHARKVQIVWKFGYLRFVSDYE